MMRPSLLLVTDDQRLKVNRPRGGRWECEAFSPPRAQKKALDRKGGSGIATKGFDVESSLPGHVTQCQPLPESGYSRTAD